MDAQSKGYAAKQLKKADIKRRQQASARRNAYLRFCKRPSFALQKAVFYTTKGHLLQRKRWPFAKRHDNRHRVAGHFLGTKLS